MPALGTAEIQEAAERTVRLATAEISHLGGAAAADAFLTHVLHHLLGVAFAECGKTRACEMMAHALVTAEELAREAG